MKNLTECKKVVREKNKKRATPVKQNVKLRKFNN